jgi:hypothetical protein
MRCRATATHSAAELALTDQRGVAMLMTLMVMLMLAALTMAFTMLGASEPQIAANLQQSTEAMGLAAAGIERVIWALNNPTAQGGLAYPLPATIPAPYDGTTDIALGTGVYRVTVTSGASNTEAVVTSEGRVPNWASYRGRRVITAIVSGLPYLDPPCTVCVADPHIQGWSTIDSRTSTCGSKMASYSKEHTVISVTDNTLYGVFSNDASPTTPNQSTDYSQYLAASNFAPFTLTQAQLDSLKDLAKANGTYYKGLVSFSSSVPDGVVFVDTWSGNPIGDPPNPLDFGWLTINAHFGTAKGWIVVMGNMTIEGTGAYSGLFYVANTLTKYKAKGPQIADKSLSGAIIAQNVHSTAANTDFETDGSKKLTIRYSCDDIRTGGGSYPRFFVKPKSWRELSG